MVKWTDHAKSQIRHIYDHIGLDELPHKSREVPELNVDAVRELSLYFYRILYEIKSDVLTEVLAVIH